MDMENMLFDLNKTDKRLYKEIYDESRQCVANINAVSFGGWAGHGPAGIHCLYRIETVS